MVSRALCPFCGFQHPLRGGSIVRHSDKTLVRVRGKLVHRFYGDCRGSGFQPGITHAPPRSLLDAVEHERIHGTSVE